jgi:phosphoglycolate phosphatase
MMNRCLLLFDLDGTLIDSRADLTAAVNVMRRSYGLEPLSLEVVMGYIGDGVHKLALRSLQGYAADLDESVRLIRSHYKENALKHTRLYPGVAEGLQRLADAGHSLAVLTNKPGDMARYLLTELGVAPHFFAILGGGDVALKPDPEGVAVARGRLTDVPDAVWMLGDHYTDLAVAEKAGIKSAFLSYGFGREHGYKPTAYFASFSALVEYFV